MNPNLTDGGTSFRGAFQYYMHDPKSTTRERVAWTHTHNMITDDPDKAWKVMAYTATVQNRLRQASGQRMTGRKMQKPVMAYSLSWHPNHDPDKDHMLETALKSMKVLGLEEHEAVVVAHRDTPHRHVHVIVNRVHPITGLVASSSNTKRKLSDFAREYQQEHNMNYCPRREENHRRRQEGEQTRYRDPQIQEAWSLSDSGRSFAAALAKHGYALARGEKRIVVVDRYGKIHNPVRHIEGIKTKDLRNRLRDLDESELPDAAALAKEFEARHAQKKQARVAPAVDLQVEFIAIVGSPQGVNKPKEPEAKPPPPKPAPPSEPDPGTLNRLQDRHLKEQAELSDHFHRKIAQEKSSLASYYRLREQRDTIIRMREKCASPPFWRRMFGLARRDREKLHALESTYADTKMRFNERVDGLEAEYVRSMISLKVRQDAERERVRDMSRDQSLSTRQSPTQQREWHARRSGPSRHIG